MNNLPASAIIEKNRLATPNAFLLLLDVEIGDSQKIYLARNTEDVVFNGNTYIAFPLEVDPVKQSSGGDIPTLSLRVANESRALEAYLEELDGLVGKKVVLRIVNSAHLADVALELTFDILATVPDAHWVTFTLGAPSPLRMRFPRHKYLADHCNWVPGGAECGCAAAAGVCAKTLAACRGYNNSRRFGGSIGLSNPGVRLA